jgi:ribosomal 30S subunit maturation factor RimM
MIGSFAHLQSGKKIGTVKDLVISKQSVVEFVVVAFEENFVLVPFDVVRVDIERRVVIIDVERERLLRFRRVARLTDFLTLSTLLRTSILLRGGGEFGLVEDLVISSRGSIDFIVVGFEEKLFAVPFSLARVDFTQKVVSIDVTRQRLLQAPSFSRDRFPNLAAKSEFSQQVNTFFQSEKGRGQQPAAPRQPTTRPPEKGTPETRPPETKPPEKRAPESRPPEKRPPESKPPQKRPPDNKPPDNRPPDSKPPAERPSKKDGA